MTTRFLLFIVLLTTLSCTSKNIYQIDKNVPMVDYPTNYESNKISLNNSQISKQTIFIYRKKEITKSTFQRLMESKKIKEIEEIKNQNTIEDFGYFYQQVKRIIVLN